MFSKFYQLIIFLIIIKRNSRKRQNYYYQKLLFKKLFTLKRRQENAHLSLEEKASVYSDEMGIKVTDRRLGDIFKILKK